MEPGSASRAMDLQAHGRVKRHITNQELLCITNEER